MNQRIDATLSPHFVEEMMRLAYNNKEFATLVTQHLDVSNFPREMGACKAMLKVLADNIKKTGSLATFGMVEMTYPNNADIANKILEVKSLPVPEFEPMVQQLETFIRRQLFVSTQHQISDMYNEGRPEEAMQLLEHRMYEINNFKLGKDSQKFKRVYRDMRKNIELIRMKAEDDARMAKIPIGITSLDALTDGGVPRQDTGLFIMRSGAGKSTFLKFVCWYNTSIAHNHVLHIQLEGGAEEAVVKFDQMIAKTTYSKIMRGDLSEEVEKHIGAVIKRAITVNSDIDLYATDEMLDMTIDGLISVIEDYHKEYGYYPDLLSVDSIDLLLTGVNKKIDFDPNFIKYRLQKCAQKLKDIAKKYDCVVWTASQTSDIPFECWNDPTWVITRQNTEGDRTLVKPFSFVLTGNITIEEGKQKLARVFCDKLRNYQNNGIVVRIPTNYEAGFFYDMPRSRTVEQVLDTSALEKLEPKRRGRKKGDGEEETTEVVKLDNGVVKTISKPAPTKKSVNHEV